MLYQTSPENVVLLYMYCMYCKWHRWIQRGMGTEGRDPLENHKCLYVSSEIPVRTPP